MGRFEDNQSIIREISTLLSNMRADLQKVSSANTNVQKLHDDYARVIQLLSSSHSEIQKISEKYLELSDEFEKAKSVAADCMKHEASAYQTQLRQLQTLSRETMDSITTNTSLAVERLESFQQTIEDIGKNNEEKITEVADAFSVLRDYTIQLADKFKNLETNLLSEKISNLSDRIEALEKSNETFIQSQRYIAQQIQQTQYTQLQSLELLQIVCKNLGIDFKPSEDR